DVVEYEYVVTNAGNVTITNISVVDNLIPNVICPMTELAPSQSVTCTGSYPVTQADVDAGEIVNIAVASGEDPNGDTVEDDDTVRLTIDQVPDIAISKVAELVAELRLGDTVEYSYHVTNTG